MQFRFASHTGHRIAQQQGSFGGVGQNQAGTGTQGIHGGHHFRRKAAVHPAVVAHHGVNHRQGVRPKVHGLLYQLGLAGIGQVAGINAVKPQAKAAVMLQGCGAVTGVGQLGRGAQPARVGGKHCCWYGNGLCPQRRKHRHNDRKPCPPKAGQIMDAQNCFRCIGHKKNAHFYIEFRSARSREVNARRLKTSFPNVCTDFTTNFPAEKDV